MQNRSKMCRRRSSERAPAGDLLQGRRGLLDIGEQELLPERRPESPRRACVSASRDCSSSVMCRTLVTRAVASSPPATAPRRSRVSPRRPSPVAPRSRRLSDRAAPRSAPPADRSCSRRSRASATPCSSSTRDLRRRLVPNGPAPRAPDPPPPTPSARAHAFLLDDVPRLADARRIDERHRHAADVRALGEQIPCRARHGRDDRAVGVEKRVEQARLSDVRRADDRDGAFAYQAAARCVCEQLVIARDQRRSNRSRVASMK